jgi:hypothetical protein
MCKKLSLAKDKQYRLTIEIYNRPAATLDPSTCKFLKALHDLVVDLCGWLLLPDDPLVQMGSFQREEILHHGDVALVGQSGNVLCGPAAQQNIELQPASLAAAEENPSLPRAEWLLAAHIGPRLRRAQVRLEPLLGQRHVAFSGRSARS